jgi:peptidoglycan/xylan/chitin deacetylase (PgdA/CDA1 family)
MTIIPILMYHGVDERLSPERRSLVSILPEEFERQMAWLHTGGYQSASLIRLARCLAEGEPLPERSFVLTFDDGFEGLYHHALPILQRYGFSATVFLVAGHVGGLNDWKGQPAVIPSLPLLSWSQIEEMSKLGIEFGSHTLTHPRLDQLGVQDWERELVGSKAVLEDRLGCPVESFAYPYGRFTPLVQRRVGQLYEAACTTQLDLVTTRNRPDALPRVDISVLHSPSIFQKLFSPWMAVYLAQRRQLRSLASKVLKRAWT